MLLESFTKHPSRSTADHIFKSVCVAGVGWDGQFSPSFKHIKF